MIAMSKCSKLNGRWESATNSLPPTGSGDLTINLHEIRKALKRRIAASIHATTAAMRTDDAIPGAWNRHASST